MPHCVIEHSEDLLDNINEIIRSVHAGAVSSGLFDSNDIKTRAISYRHYQVGISHASFIHVSSRILSGRNSSQKIMLNTAIIKELGILALPGCSITSEIIDIHKESHAKLET